MATKRKKSAKPIDENKLGPVDRTFCELTIADLNRKLARLRSHLVNLEDTNIDLTERLRSLEHDRTDVAAHLQRTLTERNEKITNLDEQIVYLTTTRNAEGQQNFEKVEELEAKYKAMYNQLISEMKLVNSKLNALDEFRLNRDELMAKLEEQETLLKEKDQLFKETIYNLEQRQVVEKDAFKKEVEAKLLQVSDDFTRSNEIRNAGYTRRLIRENIALQKEIDSLVVSQIKMQNHMQEEEKRHKTMAEEHISLCEVRDQLIINSQNKIIIIEKLTEQYENIKIKYIEALKYRQLYDKYISRDVCDKLTVKDLKKKIRYLSESVETLTRNKKQMLAQHTAHEIEIQRLRKVIESIKQAVQSVMTDLVKIEQKSDQYVEEKTDEDDETKTDSRKNLLGELIAILTSHTLQFPDTPSVSTVSQAIEPFYRTGKLGFIRSPSSSLLDTFVATRVSETIVEQGYIIKEQGSKIIPKERDTESRIIDAIMGDPLYVSSSHEDQEEIQIEEQEQVQDEEGSSSDTSYTTDMTMTDTSTENADQVIPPPVPRSIISKPESIKDSLQPAKKESPIISEVEEDEGGEEDDFLEYFY